MTVPQVMDQLRTTPVRLRELAAGVPAETLRTSPAPDEWSANDVLAHLRACSDKWGECATRIVEEDHPRLQVGAGRPVDLTAHSYAERLARHERPHVKQIARAVAVLTG